MECDGRDLGRMACGASADGQVVWSWQPLGWCQVCKDDLQATVTNKVMDTGESTEQPLTPLRRECRCFGFTRGEFTHVLS